MVRMRAGEEVETQGRAMEDVLVLLVLVDDLDAMVVLFSGRGVADGGEVTVHDRFSSWKRTRIESKTDLGTGCGHACWQAVDVGGGCHRGWTTRPQSEIGRGGSHMHAVNGHVAPAGSSSVKLACPVPLGRAGAFPLSDDSLIPVESPDTRAYAAI